jgi:hypothetical protein
MICSIKSQAERRYRVRSLAAAGFCILFAMFAKWAFRHGHPDGVVAYLIAVLPALPIVAVLVFTAIYLDEEKDEFQRNLLVQAYLGGTGGILASATVWSYLEDFSQVPHIDMIWMFPAFCFFTAISYVVVKARYR